MKVCKIKDCKLPGEPMNSGKMCFRLGYCVSHYRRFKKYGDPLYIKQVKNQNRKSHYLYNTYKKMRQRCYSQSCKDYPDYGGRGIKVCARWMEVESGFWHFVEDLGERPDGFTLDRINVNGIYAPENVRWATAKEQRNNQRRCQ